MAARNAWLARHVTRQVGGDSRYQISQPTVGIRLASRGRQWRNQPHHRAVGTMLRDGIPKQVPLDCKLVVDDPTALLKPVVHESTLIADLAQRAADPQGLTGDRHVRELALAEIVHLPADAR